MEAEAGAERPRARERGTRQPPGGAHTSQHLDCGLPDSRTLRSISAVLRHGLNYMVICYSALGSEYAPQTGSSSRFSAELQTHVANFS